MKVTISAATAVLGIALGAAPAAADTRISYDGDDGEGMSNILIRDGKVSMQTGRGDVMLFDERSSTLTMIDHRRRSFFRLDPQTLERQAAAMQGQAQQMQQLGPMMEQMRAQLQSVLDNPDIPQAQKDMLARQLEQMGNAGAAAAAPAPSAPVRLEATGQRQRVAGIPCAVHRLHQGGQALREVCVASPADAGVPREDYRTARAMFAFLRTMAERSASMMGMGTPGAMPDLDGIPVAMRNLRDGTASSLREITTGRLDAGLFALPEGYREADPFRH